MLLAYGSVGSGNCSHCGSSSDADCSRPAPLKDTPDPTRTAWPRVALRGPEGIMLRFIICFLSVICLLLLAACSDSGYLLQCSKGHLDLMSRARPIDALLASDTISAELRSDLSKIVQLRDFAVHSLDLPDSGSYKEYADLNRPFAVWNLVAAPELSLDLQQWCYPIAGCVTYRGYFTESLARQEADRYENQGFDVYVYGVKAYSTLKWFDDPVLNTFFSGDDLQLAALLFHEMAHQVVYLPGETSFNESFAKTVEMEGVRRWLINTDSTDLWDVYQTREARSAQFHTMLDGIRGRLRKVYNAKIDDERKKAEKIRILDSAKEEYAALKAGWGGSSSFDGWIQSDLNNARLSSMSTYYGLVPVFQSMLQSYGNDLQKFYAGVAALVALDTKARADRLKAFALQAGLASDKE